MGEVRFRQLVHPLRTITAQGEDIINAAGFHVAKDAGDAIFFAPIQVRWAKAGTPLRSTSEAIARLLPTAVPPAPYVTLI